MESCSCCRVPPPNRGGVASTWKSDPLTTRDGPELSREEVTVHGRNAVLVVSRSKESPSRIKAAIHFPNPAKLPNSDANAVKLTVYMELNEESSVPIARKNFDSIRFRKD